MWLIDFAQTREGPPLFDFAHLGAELIAHVLAERAAGPEDYLARLQGEAEPLLAALHGIARRCLFNPLEPREYWLALYFACLGALKFTNLGRKAKQCLYLTAAYQAGQLVI